MKKLSSEFLENHWQTENTPWDIGYLSPPLKAFIDDLTNKNLRILIPGAGSAYEAVYLFENGFRNVYVCDWAESAFSNLRKKLPDFPNNQCLITDFFKLNLEVDLIIEQTFFCAIDPNLRTKYAEKTADILSENGMLAGLLFAAEFPFEGPPFGGTKSEYVKIFEPYYKITEMKIAKNSIGPRMNNELFVKFKKS